MAIFGGLGKALGLGSAGEFVGGIVEPLFGPTAGRVASTAAQTISTGVSGLGQEVDVSAPPAGVDAPATIAPVSQTSQLRISPAAQGFGPAMAQQAFIGGAGLGALATQGIGAATRLLSRPGVGGLVGGLGAGAVVDFFIDQFGQQKKLVITRKMQRDVKKLFMMSGGDFNMTAELYRMATGRSITGEQVVKIITKTFKNQGPYVTKAAVRKTRQTIRKMETLCDLKDRLAPPKRRAPARRRTMSTSITQVK
ncbi:MAG: hypothetical protein CBC65_003705 [Rhodothermaceae bacterium TMED105]|jgi:hypothetical protein|nr:MAG: hypothetical protein CBC65_003665 [Rhodothermaceae bacterium TMED105]RPF80800.1 MAG: hypothetical protein CBC65_003685 [Rhodothermaceae bacterium TMED105]RPF80804.1 MAG: hypothetical protein CBC65_003705 [Rhodothermaceae bacterium TMED105]|tara:strand:- start:200 stop:955 length:756 start_codon:yes stop_codon:yes gene_type:complete